MRLPALMSVATVSAAGPAAASGGPGGGLRAAGTPSFLFILGDDIGWADFRYNNGTSYTPNVDAWVARDGSAYSNCLPTHHAVAA